jgi:CRISPR/Cas system CSM-associated protein Csm4 (group 5 of RAMP superfamily)
MEKYLIDYEIDREKEAEKEPEKGPVMDHDERKEEKSQEEKERAEKARKAQNRANAAWQAKEYEQINVKLPRGLKKAFLLACKERNISGRQYIIESMRKLVDETLDRFDIP